MLAARQAWKIDGKWRYCKPVVGRNNKIVPEQGRRRQAALA
jgi:hypothetical protein